MKIKILWLTLLATVWVVGCSGSAPVETGTDSPTRIPPTDEPPPTVSAPATSTSSPTSVPRLFDRPNVLIIDLLTPVENAGQQPRFEWQAVPGAARYSLWVLDEAGETYWAWEGSDTFVHLGGGPEAPSGTGAGARLIRPMHWTVVAFDTDGRVIGSSEIVPISP